MEKETKKNIKKKTKKNTKTLKKESMVEKKEVITQTKSKKKKVIILIFLIFLLLGGLGFEWWYYFKDCKKKTSIQNEVEPISYTFHEELFVPLKSELLDGSAFFLEETDATILKYVSGEEEITFESVYDKLGTYKVFLLLDGKVYFGTLIVYDFEKPTLEVHEVSVKEGTGVSVSDFVTSCVDNSEEECKLSTKEELPKEVGTYDVVIQAKDASDNKVESTTKLTITSKTSNSSSNKNNYNPNSSVKKPGYVDTKIESTSTTSDAKYGLKKTVWHVTYYDYYSDGSKLAVYSYDHVEYDRSGYNGTTATLLAEAKQNKVTYASMVNEVLSYTNQYRAELGLSPLTLDDGLTNGAMVRALEMAYSGKFSHTRPDGTLCRTVLSDLGLPSNASENIAMGYTSAASVSKGWKNSKGHYANMVSSWDTKIGIGVANIDGTYYWVQMFEA